MTIEIKNDQQGRKNYEKRHKMTSKAPIMFSKRQKITVDMKNAWKETQNYLKNIKMFTKRWQIIIDINNDQNEKKNDKRRHRLIINTSNNIKK